MATITPSHQMPFSGIVMKMLIPPPRRLPQSTYKFQTSPRRLTENGQKSAGLVVVSDYGFYLISSFTNNVRRDGLSEDKLHNI